MKLEWMGLNWAFANIIDKTSLISKETIKSLKVYFQLKLKCQRFVLDTNLQFHTKMQNGWNL